MPCKLDVATEVKQDILDCNGKARTEIGDFLLALQRNPLPAERRPMGGPVFYAQLACGFYVSWEIIGDLLHYALTGDSSGLVIRILGVARVAPW